jgi:predicted peroxiredoxin
MKKKLGICVATKNNMPHVIGLATAAGKAGIHTEIFLTGDGVHKTQDSRFSELLKAAGKLSVCEVSYLAFGYKKDSIHGLNDKDFATQIRNADMVEKCDRYLVL